MTIRGIPQDPSTWTLADVSAAASVGAVSKVPRGVGSGPEYVAGNHLQDGETWQGPGREADGVGLSDTMLDRIRLKHAPVPEVAGCVRERVNGACGNQADISIAPTEPVGADGSPSDQQAKDADEWKRLISRWWDDNRLWGGMNIQKPTGVRGAVAMASSYPHGCASLRAFISPATLQTRKDAGAAASVSRIPSQDRTRKAALRKIKIVALPPSRCGVYVDPDTQQRTGYFLFNDANEQPAAEIWYSAEAQDGREVTVLRMVRSEGEAEERTIPTGGLLPIAQFDIGTLLTEPVLKLQGFIDFLNTALSCLAEAHGFASRSELNSEEDGYWQTVPPTLRAGEVPRTRTVDGEVQYFNPQPAVFGNLILRRVLGIEHTTSIDETTGKETVGLTTPSVHYHEPSPLSVLIEGLDREIMAVRDACHQGHRRNGLLGSTAEASGDAYEQARAMFLADVKSVGEAIDTPLAQLLAWVTMAADWIAGDDSPTFLDDWTVTVQSHANAGPVSSLSQQSTLSLVQGKLISAAEGTARVGVQDVQGERDRIEAERTIGERGTEVAELIGSGADPVAAWIAAGIPANVARALAQGDGQPFVQQ